MWLFHPARIHVAGLGASFAEDQGPESSLVNLNANRDTPVQVGTAHQQVPHSGGPGTEGLSTRPGGVP